MKLPLFQRCLNPESSRRSYFILYTFIFLIIAFLCYSWFIFAGKSLIWKGDGYSQHLKALAYYAQYLRGIIKSILFDHSPVIPDWDFYIGEGSDIISTFHYYCIGDPIALFSVFVPTHYMPYFYSFSCLLRMYLSGIFFSLLCFETGQKNKYGILAGSVQYSFCHWALVNSSRHIMFLNSMLYFPLMILGIEKTLNHKKPCLFIIATAISAACNFYFFYMIVILTILYAIVRLALLYKRHLKQITNLLLRLGFNALVGVCISGIIFFPILMVFLHDSRLSSSQPFHLLYPISYYSQLPSVFLTHAHPYWLCMGFAPPVLLSVVLLFSKRKEGKLLKVLFSISALIIIFPIGGRILNGMSYMANRWSWAFALLCSYILVHEWDRLRAVTAAERKVLFAFSISFYIACLLFDKSRSISSMASMPLLFITLIISGWNSTSFSKKELKQICLIILMAVGITNISFWYFSPSTGNYLARCKEYKSLWSNWVDNEASEIAELSDLSYTRMSGRSLTKNANIRSRISSTQYYWTNANPSLSNFRTSLQMREPLSFDFQGYDDRTTPIALSSVQYYYAGSINAKGIPFGFSKVKSESESVYKNNYALPIAYTYDSYYTQQTRDSLNPVQKQESQLEAAYVTCELPGLDCLQTMVPDYIIPHSIECSGSGITMTDNSFITTGNNKSVILHVSNGAENAETYVGIEGLQFEPTSKYSLYFGDESVDPNNLYDEEAWDALSVDNQITIRKKDFFWDPVQNTKITFEASGVKKKLKYLQPDSHFSSGRHDYIVNLGYRKDHIKDIKITFPSPGIYSFDNLTVYSIPMDEYPEKIARLKEYSLENVRIGNDEVSGNITVDKTKLLCLSMPFSDGWNACIDNTPVDVYCLNERHMGILIPPGSHAIEFRYSMPYKRIGIAISISGCFLFVIICLLLRKEYR